MAAITFITKFCKTNSLQFHEGEHDSYSTSAFDCLSYREKLMQWQTAKPYEQKVTFDDTITLMVHTQANTPSSGASAYPVIELYDINDNFITAISSGTYGLGSQQNANNVIYPSFSPLAFPLDSYLWQFSFGDLIADSGCYYLKFINLGSDGTTSQVYYSEPVLVYDDVPNTIVITGKNLTNREAQKILINGWASAGTNPTFSIRVEGYVNLYKPKGVYIAYLQQQYLAQQLSSQNFRTFTLQIGGSPTHGVPDYMLEKVTELLIMDNLTINDGKTNTSYVYDGDGDSSPKIMGNKSDPEASQLCWDKFPLREKFANQDAFYRVVDNSSTPFHLFTTSRDAFLGGLFLPSAVAPWDIVIDGVTHSITPVQTNTTQAEEDTYLAYIQAQFAIFGATGTVTRNNTTGQFFYNYPATETVSLPTPVIVLTKYVKATYNTSAASAFTSYIHAGATVTPHRHIVNWGDGSANVLNTQVTTSPSSIGHTYTSMAATTDAWFFHDDRATTMDWNGNTQTALLKSMTGKLSAINKNFIITNNGSMTTPHALLVLATCASTLQTFTFANNAGVAAFTGTIFTAHMPNCTVVSIQQCGFTTAQIDQHINDFVNNSWVGASGGSLQVWGNAGAASAASLTSRNTLAAAGWTITI